MAKVIRLTEEDLRKIIGRVINEQGYAIPGGYPEIMKKSAEGDIKRVQNIFKKEPPGEKQKLFWELCEILYKARDKSWESGITKMVSNTIMDMIPFVTSLKDWYRKNSGLDPKFLKALVTLLIRESKVSSLSHFRPREVVGLILNIVGGDRTQGYAQIKPSTAKKYGVDMGELYSFVGSLNSAYKIFMTDYNKAKKFYRGNYVTIFENGKLKTIPAIGGDAALHIAFAAYNAGDEVINEWCQTNVPNIANPCSTPSREYDNKKNPAVTDKKKPIRNYFPNLGKVHTYMPQIEILYNNLGLLPEKLDQLVALT